MNRRRILIEPADAADALALAEEAEAEAAEAEAVAAAARARARAIRLRRQAQAAEAKRLLTSKQPPRWKRKPVPPELNRPKRPKSTPKRPTS